MKFSHIYTVALALTFSSSAWAQSGSDLSGQMQAALKDNDAETALAYADQLYALTSEQGDMAQAGKAAFSRGKILTSLGRHVESGEAYGDCDEHYQKINGLAQSLNCRYQSGLAYLDGSKKGTAIDALKSTAKELTQIGQQKSGLAADVYLTLAKEILPPKLQRKRSAIRGRLDSVKYADMSLAALDALGQDKSVRTASVLLLKGKALEDSEKYEDAAAAYSKAIVLYTLLPDTSEDVLKNASTRLSIVKSMGSDEKDDNTLMVLDASGEKIILQIKKKKPVRFPRVDRNKLIDGARASAEITLNEDGSVATLKVLESMPEADFGEELEKAVKNWKFTPPEGISPADIPPFTYGMSFYVERR